MTRRITETFHGFEQPDVLVTIDGAEHSGELRAWALDDESGDWWGLCQYRLEPGQRMLGWIHQDQVRRDGDLTDDDGRMGPIPTAR